MRNTIVDLLLPLLLVVISLVWITFYAFAAINLKCIDMVRRFFGSNDIGGTRGQ